MTVGMLGLLQATDLVLLLRVDKSTEDCPQTSRGGTECSGYKHVTPHVQNLKHIMKIELSVAY